MRADETSWPYNNPGGDEPDWAAGDGHPSWPASGNGQDWTAGDDSWPANGNGQDWTAGDDSCTKRRTALTAKPWVYANS